MKITELALDEEKKGLNYPNLCSLLGRARHASHLLGN